MNRLIPLAALVLAAPSPAFAAMVVIVTGKQAQPSTLERTIALVQSVLESLVGWLA